MNEDSQRNERQRLAKGVMLWGMLYDRDKMYIVKYYIYEQSGVGKM